MFLFYGSAMHEMAIAASLIDIVKEEMAKHGASKLLMVRVCYGKLTNVVPDALAFAFEVQTKETPLDGAELELKELPITVTCGECSTEFSTEGTDLFYMPCPSCENLLGHAVITGKDLYLDHLEAE